MIGCSTGLSSVTVTVWPANPAPYLVRQQRNVKEVNSVMVVKLEELS
jgi:hypothetical protein